MLYKGGFILFLLLFTQTAYSQKGTIYDKWGKDSAMTVQKMQLYREFWEVNRLDRVYPRWRWLIAKAPKAYPRIYIDGIKLIKYKMETVPERKDRYIDTLFMVYDRRLKFIGENGRYLGWKAKDLFEYRLTGEYFPLIYETARRSVELQQEKSETEVIEIFYKMSIVLSRNDSIAREQFFKDMMMVHAAIGPNLKMPEKKDAYLKVRNYVFDNMRQQGIPKGRQDAIPIFSGIFNAYGDETEIVEWVYKELKKFECRDTKLFVNVAKNLYEEQPDKAIALEVARASQSIENPDTALAFYKKVLENETEDSLKSIRYCEMAGIYFELDSMEAARTNATLAIDSDSGSAHAHSLLADILLESNDSVCAGDSIFGNKILHLYALHLYKKAVEIEPVLKDSVNSKIIYCNNMLPTADELSQYELKEGDYYYIPCLDQKVPLKARRI